MHSSPTSSTRAASPVAMPASAESFDAAAEPIVIRFRCCTCAGTGVSGLGDTCADCDGTGIDNHGP